MKPTLENSLLYLSPDEVKLMDVMRVTYLKNLFRECDSYPDIHIRDIKTRDIQLHMMSDTSNVPSIQRRVWAKALMCCLEPGDMIYIKMMVDHLAPSSFNGSLFMERGTYVKIMVTNVDCGAYVISGVSGQYKFNGLSVDSYRFYALVESLSESEMNSELSCIQYQNDEVHNSLIRNVSWDYSKHYDDQDVMVVPPSDDEARDEEAVCSLSMDADGDNSFSSTATEFSEPAG